MSWQLGWPPTSCRFVSRRVTGGRLSPVGTRHVFTNLASLAKRGAVRFLLWWLSSTAGYVSGNEARTFVRATSLPTGGSSPTGATRFYPGAHKALRLCLAGLSASAQGVSSNLKPPDVTLSQSVTGPFADPCVGLGSRNLRDDPLYTSGAFESQIFRRFICVLFFDRCNCPPNGLLYVGSLLIVRIRMARPKKTFQTVFSAPGNDMNMQVGDALADAIINGYKRAMGFQALFDRLRQKLRILEERFQQLFREIGQRLVMFPRNQQTVAGKDWAIVQKGDRKIVFKHPTS
jgi:hypothetical protein